MNVIKEADFRKELKSAPSVGYLFFGDEDYLKSFSVNQVRELICPDPSLSVFNELRVDALDFTPDKLLDAITPMPMMADRKLVLLSGLNFNSMKQTDVDALCDVLAQLPDYDYNLLIVTVAADCLDAGYLPQKPSTTFKKLSEHLTPVQFDRCTNAKLAAWIRKHFAHNGVEASPEFCAAMPDFCGHSMFELANEIDKLSYYVLSHGMHEATTEHMRLVCTPAEEYDTFAFTNATMDGKHDTALAILADFRFRRIDPVIILSEVTGVICDMITIQAMTADGIPTANIATTLKHKTDFKVKLYQRSLRNTTEARLRRALDACSAADLSLKSASKGYTALEKLICTL